MYRLPPSDCSLADIERFTALSIRRGSTLASLAKSGADDLRAALAAAALALLAAQPPASEAPDAGAGRTLSESEALAALAKLLAGPGDWLAETPASLLAALEAQGWAERREAAGGPAVEAIAAALPGATFARLADDVDCARAILAERRARRREVVMKKNREANPAVPPGDPALDRRFMALALEEARKARDAGEIPVGAVLAKDDELVAAAGNRTLRDCDPTAHAEVLALRAAAKRFGNHRLSDLTLYVTLEPCPMCAGAICEARCRRIVYGAPDPKRGALEGAIRLFDLPGVNHRPRIDGGLFAAEASALLADFFAERRAKAPAENSAEAPDKSSLEASPTGREPNHSKPQAS